MENLLGTFGLGVGALSLWGILGAVVVLLVCILVSKLLLKLYDKAISKSKLDATLTKYLRTALKIVLYALSILIAAGQLGIDVTSLIAVFSVAGLALSLALQNSLSNVAGGIMLLVCRPFVVGDFVELGSASGNVTEVGLFYTQITTLDNRVIQIPNSDISANRIVNYTANRVRRVDMTVSAAYSFEPEAVKASILKSAAQVPGVLSEPEAPFVRVSEYGGSAIEYVVRVWCSTDDYWNVYFDLKEQLKAGFDADGIAMSYQHINIHMIQD